MFSDINAFKSYLFCGIETKILTQYTLDISRDGIVYVNVAPLQTRIFDWELQCSMYNCLCRLSRIYWGSIVGYIVILNEQMKCDET